MPFQKGHKSFWTIKTKQKMSKRMKGHKRGFKKGHIPWSKGKKGIHLSRKSEFKKGNMIGNQFAKGNPPNKGSFKKGQLAGNKHHNWKGGISSIRTKIWKSQKYQEWRQQIFRRDNFICQKCNQVGGFLEAHHIKTFIKLPQEVKLNLPLLDLYDAIMIYTPIWDIDNGITLCRNCHNLTKGNKKNIHSL